MSDTCVIPNVKYRIKKVAPEGSWGYLIVISVASLACCLGNQNSFGLMFNDFIKSVGAQTSAVTLIFGVGSIVHSFASLFSGALYKRFSMRSVSLFGALLFFLGGLVSIFITSVEMLTLSFGVLQGAGVGLILPAVYATFNQYFVKRRVFMLGMSQALKGVLLMFHPILVGIVMDVFGFRGAMAIIAAINAHVIFGMLVMHPIEWHYKLIKVPVDEQQPLMISNNEGIELSDKVDVEVKIDDTDENQPKWFNPLQTVNKFLDLTLFNDVIYLNIMFVLALATFADNMFFTLLPIYLIDIGFSNTDAATLVAIAAAGDLISRVAIAVLSLLTPLKIRYVTFAGMAAIIFMRFVFIYLADVVGMKLVVITMGMLRTTIHAVFPLVLAEYLPNELFPNGLAYYMFFQGNFGFLFGPIIGWIRDTTQSYVICFNSLSAILGLCVILWSIELVWIKITSNKKK